MLATVAAVMPLFVAFARCLVNPVVFYDLLLSVSVVALLSFLLSLLLPLLLSGQCVSLPSEHGIVQMRGSSCAHYPGVVSESIVTRVMHNKILQTGDAQDPHGGHASAQCDFVDPVVQPKIDGDHEGEF